MALFKKELNLDFIGKRKFSFAISAIVIAICIASIFTRGLAFGIDFTGGTLMEIRTTEAPNLGDMRTELNTLGFGNISVQEFGSDKDLLIRVPKQDTTQISQEDIINTIQDKLGKDDIDYRRIEYVGPQVGEELIDAGVQAVIFSLIGILFYIWIRFEWQFGIAAVVALAHDTLMIIGLFSITQMEFNLSTVAAVLMIAGYSINDTVVVFDRVRENLRKYKKKAFADVFNLSINQTLSRTIITSVTTMLALIALWVFGGEVIRGFIDALIVGILVGTYSSIFIATPTLLYMNMDRDILSNNDDEEEKAQQAGA